MYVGKIVKSYLQGQKLDVTVHVSLILKKFLSS
jgi:hypothetical protein